MKSKLIHLSIKLDFFFFLISQIVSNLNLKVFCAAYTRVPLVVTDRYSRTYSDISSKLLKNNENTDSALLFSISQPLGKNLNLKEFWVFTLNGAYQG